MSLPSAPQALTGAVLWTPPSMMAATPSSELMRGGGAAAVAGLAVHALFVSLPKAWKARLCMHVIRLDSLDSSATLRCGARQPGCTAGRHATGITRCEAYRIAIW